MTQSVDDRVIQMDLADCVVATYYTTEFIILSWFIYFY